MEVSFADQLPTVFASVSHAFAPKAQDFLAGVECGFRGDAEFMLEHESIVREPCARRCYANAANSSSIAFTWPPLVEDGTRIGVFTPAANQASRPSITCFFVP